MHPQAPELADRLAVRMRCRRTPAPGALNSLFCPRLPERIMTPVTATGNVSQGPAAHLHLVIGFLESRDGPFLGLREFVTRQVLPR